MKTTKQINENKKPTIRRIVAFIIDFIIVAYIAGLFASIEFLNPYLDKYNETTEKYLETFSNMDSNEITFTADEIVDMDYDLSYYGSITSLITIAVTLLYFVVFQYFNKGKTIGKAILKIKVVNDKNERPYLIQLLLRSLIVNSIVTNLFSNILVIFASKEVFINTNVYIQFVNTGLLLVTFGMMIIRDDGRGLHDLFGKTHVVFINQEVNTEIKEAIVEEKKEVTKEPLLAETKKPTAKKRKKGTKNENSNRK